MAWYPHGNGYRKGFPSIPYIAMIPEGMQAGKAITLKGLVLDQPTKRIGVNLCCGLLVDGDHRDNIAIHFNPRFDTDELVLNTLINNRWAIEQKAPLTACVGQPITIRILALTNMYKISVNEKHVADYPHQVPIDEVKTIYIWGCLSLDFIEFEGAGERVSRSVVNQEDLAPVVPVTEKPKVPYFVDVPVGTMAPGRTLRSTIVIRNHADRFNYNFYIGQEIAFHFDVRFKPREQVVRNTFRNGKWETEETQISKFIFVYGGTYDFNIMCTVDGYDVYVNDSLYIHFEHRMKPHGVNKISVENGVRLLRFQL